MAGLGFHVVDMDERYCYLKRWDTLRRVEKMHLEACDRKIGKSMTLPMSDVVEGDTMFLLCDFGHRRVPMELL